jgi:exopolysaccharide production protein ExoQ
LLTAGAVESAFAMTIAWSSDPFAAAPAPPLSQRRLTLADVSELAAVFFLMVLMSAALLGPLANPQQLVEKPGWIKQVWPPAYLLTLVLIAYRWRDLQRVWLASLPHLLIVAFAGVSLLWSIMPHLTSRRSMAFAFVTLFGVYLAGAFDWRRLVNLIGGVLVFLGVCSVVMALALPSIGVHHGLHDGAWRGAWFEKNAMGAWMVLGACACLASCVLDTDRRRWWILGFVLCAVLVKMTTSATALVVLTLSCAAFVGVWVLRRGPLWGVVLVWAVVAVVLAAVTVLLVNPHFAFGLIGRDLTLTGRTDIWAALLRRWAERPWAGYGYSGFWHPDSPPANIVRHELNWDVRNADGAWVQVLIELGVLGVIGCALLVLAGWAAALRSLGRGEHAYWCVMFLLVICGYSISESNLMRPNDLMWALLVATTVKLWAGDEPVARAGPPRATRPSWPSVSNPAPVWSSPPTTPARRGRSASSWTTSSKW